ncbi:MAG: FKBP-type peptidyl-prolyl cis-trans isomerase [Pseudomonadota bacterium]
MKNKVTQSRFVRAACVIAGIGLIAACQSPGSDCEPVSKEKRLVEASVPKDVAGLEATITTPGRDHAVASGDTATMHYTGWLFDESAEDGRGEKFDSSRDRNRTFEFPLGGGRVIRGWDLGVAGMQIGEVRELKISPELGYGDRGAGNAIPPNATLLFEVELVSFTRCEVFD